MATETYPKPEAHPHSDWGTIMSGWKSGYGTKYPNTALASTKDDRGMSHIKQSRGCSCDAPSSTYPKGTPGHKKFRKLEGLP